MTQTYRFSGLLLLVLAGLASGEARAQPSDPQQVAVNALECWRDVGQRSITVGASFTMTITCRAVETDTAMTVPDEAALAPETIDLTPFEVLEGHRFPDVLGEPYRTFQYHYVLRLIDEEHFGLDAEIPGLELTYRIDRALDGGAMTPGRELRYLLAPESVRVLSLVPEGATDIEDLPVSTLGEADDRRFRANTTLLGAVGAGLAGLVLLGLAAAHLRRHYRGAVPADALRLADRTVVERVLDELSGLRRGGAGQTWDSTRTGRALAALRLAGATALSLPVAQDTVAPESPGRDGQLRVTRGLLRPRTVSLSASVTPDSLTAEMDHIRSSSSGSGRIEIARDIVAALTTFTAARYGATDGPPGEQLTRALDAAIAAVRKLRVQSFKPVHRAGRAIESTRRVLAHRRLGHGQETGQ